MGRVWEEFGEHLGGSGEGLSWIWGGFGGCFERILYSTSLAFLPRSLLGVLGQAGQMLVVFVLALIATSFCS